jgi:hypothetical protein
VLLTEEQLRQFREDGYALVPGLLPVEELMPVRDRLLQLMVGDHDWPEDHFQVIDPSRFRNPKGGLVPLGVQGPAHREEIFRRIADHPNLRTAMAELLNGPVRRYTDQCIIRNKDIRGGESFFHQDSYYWRIRPEAGCNVWLPLDPVGREAGALAIMPGTQKNWTLEEHEDYYDNPSYHTARNGQAFMRHRIPAAKIDFSREQLLEMQPGDAVFFTNFTWHRAEKNLSDNHLCAYAIAYQLDEDDVKMPATQ